MEANNLAYINTAANEALVRETEGSFVPTVVREVAAQAGQRVVAGFALDDEAAREEAFNAALAKRRKLINAYQTQRDQVVAKLGTLGIEPLAILPKTAWERICSQSGLFRLTPNDKGEVYVSDRLVSQSRQFAGAAELLSFIGASLLGGVATGLWLHTFPQVPWFGSVWGSVLAAGILFLCSVLTAGAGDSAVSDWIKGVFVKVYLSHKSKRPWDVQMREFFPGGISPGSSTIRAKIILPDPR